MECTNPRSAKARTSVLGFDQIGEIKYDEWIWTVNGEKPFSKIDWSVYANMGQT